MIEADIVLVGPTGAVEPEGLDQIEVGAWGGGGGGGSGGGGGDPHEAGRLSALAIERAVSLALAGHVDAIVTAPISKSALVLAGYDWPGHTEMLRDLAGVADTALCLTCEESPLGAPLRVVLVTGHIPLRAVPDAFSAEQLERSARLAREGLSRLWGIREPRLAVCAINPHASEGGLFGDEEARVCSPVIERLRGEGIDISGPFPADTVFLRAMRGETDAVLAPYHDVGMTAIKTACFGRAVNVTLGLPFPRTSPDHGTAFDIAKSGRADASSMRAALELAVAFATRSLTSDGIADKLRQGRRPPPLPPPPPL